MSAVAGVNSAAQLHRLSVVPLASGSSHRASCLVACSLVLASPLLRLLSLLWSKGMLAAGVEAQIGVSFTVCFCLWR
ncbi:hypothetical protein S245_024607 [Arachis hypogaea]